jgi:hypothetical protein
MTPDPNTDRNPARKPREDMCAGIVEDDVLAADLDASDDLDIGGAKVDLVPRARPAGHVGVHISDAQGGDGGALRVSSRAACVGE